jgi:hypothetical protein
MDGGESVRIGAILVIWMMIGPAAGLIGAAAGDHCRESFLECQDNDAQNNDDFTNAQQIVAMVPGDYLAGSTGLGQTHRIDTFVIRNIPSGMVVNASVRITNWNSNDNQALLVSGWNKYHMDNLAWSNREDNPDRREWEAVTFLCVVTGDYYIQLKPIAGSGTFQYQLNVRVFDPQNITGSIGTGGVFGPAILGKVSSLKWYPGAWYKIQMAGEIGGLNEYLYANLTLPGGPEERLQGDLYVRNLEQESWSCWLNHSWWLCSHVQNEEVHLAACHPGLSWYYLDVQAYNTTGGRSEDYELRLTKTLIESDGDNHPLNATKVTYEHGLSTVRKQGSVRRGPDMFDWYKVHLEQGKGVSANLSLDERSTAIFRLSIYRDNLTSPYPEKGYDLMSSWTNKPADTVLNRVNALTTNVSQAGWYYIAVMAQIGLDPLNTSNLADWTVCTAWANYRLDLTIGCSSSHCPMVKNRPARTIMPEDGADGSLQLNWTGNNSGVFWDEDFEEDWGDELNFSCVCDPNFTISIDNSHPETPATIRPRRDWNGESNLTFIATDLFGRTNSTVVPVRVTPAEDPPYVKARIPDFQVKEGDYNLTLKDIDLFEVFADPDFAPYGNDNLTFSVDNTTFPSIIIDNKLTFGQAPRFPGTEDHVVMVTVTATDRSGSKVDQKVNITVVNLNRAPDYCETANMIEIMEDEVSCFDLNRLFTDPDGDPMDFAYLGGASYNLTVEMAPNGSAILRPAHDYFAAQEILRFKAIDPLGANGSGELMVRIRNVFDPLPPLGGMVPDPLDDICLNEGEALTFRVFDIYIDNRTSELKYTWYVDGMAVTSHGGPAYTLRTGYDDSGRHGIKVVVSDGLSRTEADWNITINDTNRPPVVLRAWPMNNTEVDWDSTIRFSAEAVDPDGGPLAFTWRFSDGRIIHRDSGVTNSSFSRRMPSGRMNIVVLDVTDAGGMVTREFFYIDVGAQGNDMEITWAMIWECALAFVVAILLVLRLGTRKSRISRDR